MEAAGQAIGVASLFSTLFDMYNRIRVMKGIKGSLNQQQQRLGVEIERLRYIKKKYDSKHFEEEESKQLLGLILQTLNDQLSTIMDLFARHSLASGDELRPGGTNEDAIIGAATTVAVASSNDKRQSVLSRFRWAACDEDDLDRSLNRLHFTINTLWSFASDEAERAKNDFLLRAHALKTPEVAMTMDSSQYPDITKAARIKQLLRRSLLGYSSDVGHHVSSLYIPVTSIKWSRKSSLNESLDKPWAMATLAADHVLVEWRVPFLGGRVTRSAAEQRLDRLCELLQAMYVAERDDEVERARVDAARRVVDFAQLPCIGWTLASEESLIRIGLVFRNPSGANNLLPMTLRDRISASRSIRTSVPPLGERFDLALGVAYAVANIISIGWMHRAIRSENMLSFTPNSVATSKLYLVGFTYARPGDDTSEFSDLPEGKSWAFYRPPTMPMSTSHDTDFFDDESSFPMLSAASPAGTSSAAHDLYALGIVLLEIGHWTTVDKMAGNRGLEGDLQGFQTKELPAQVQKLAARCGSIYQNVVRMCLDTTSWTEDRMTDKLADVIQSLSACRA